MDIYFAFSLHKAGSTLFYKLIRKAINAYNNINNYHVMHEQHINYYSVPHDLRRLGYNDDVFFDKDFLKKSNYKFQNTGVYGGFRYVPEFLDNNYLADHKLMLLVRDPRDMLTSLYFSIKESHVITNGDAGNKMKLARERIEHIDIDTFINSYLENNDYARNLDRISSIRDISRSWRYEDVIFNKDTWFDEIIEYLDINLPQHIKSRIVNSENIIPEIENSKSHIRKVSPGDSKNKLRYETIELINNICSEFIKTWNY